MTPAQTTARALIAAGDEDAVARRCGTCRLWGPNFYKAGRYDYGTCCADAIMDLPAAFDRNRLVPSYAGQDCSFWSLPTAKEG